MQAGFFFPETLHLFGEEQQAYHAQDQMTHHGGVPADLKVVQPDLAFALLEEPLDAGPAERGVQHDFGSRVLGRVGQKVFDLAVQHVASNDQPALVAGQVVVPREEPRELRLPHHRAVSGILDVKRVPRPLWMLCERSSTRRHGSAPGARDALRRGRPLPAGAADGFRTAGRFSQPLTEQGISTTQISPIVVTSRRNSVEWP